MPFPLLRKFPVEKSVLRTWNIFSCFSGAMSCVCPESVILDNLSLEKVVFESFHCKVNENFEKSVFSQRFSSEKCPTLTVASFFRQTAISL